VKFQTIKSLIGSKASMPFIYVTEPVGTKGFEKEIKKDGDYG
jgi:hypothetical protein